MEKIDYEYADLCIHKILESNRNSSQLGTWINKKKYDNFSFVLMRLIDEEVLIKKGVQYKINPAIYVEIEKHGSYSEYINKINKAQKREAIKNNNEYYLSKYKKLTFWPVFTFGLIGGVYSVYSILIQSFGETIEQKIEHILEEKELEVKSHTLILNQKNIDSLNISKNNAILDTIISKPKE